MTAASSGCSFDVREIGVEDPSEDDVLIVGLAEHRGGADGRHLIFELALWSDEQDRDLGMDTYCLITETGATHYGGVTSCVLEGNMLNIALDADAATSLGIQAECELRLLVASQDIALLAEGLRKVLTGGSTGPDLLVL